MQSQCDQECGFSSYSSSSTSGSSTSSSSACPDFCGEWISSGQTCSLGCNKAASATDQSDAESKCANDADVFGGTCLGVCEGLYGWEWYVCYEHSSSTSNSSTSGSSSSSLVCGELGYCAYDWVGSGYDFWYLTSDYCDPCECQYPDTQGFYEGESVNSPCKTLSS
jgi:hypothetical protein